LTLFIFHFFLFEYYSAYALEMYYRIVVSFFCNEVSFYQNYCYFSFRAVWRHALTKHRAYKVHS